jgi:hypothetical protein
MKHLVSAALMLFLLMNKSYATRIDRDSLTKSNIQYPHYSLSRKRIPVEFQEPILSALSYFAELEKVKIRFRVKHAYSPLSTRPSWMNVLKRGDRRLYIVTISDSSVNKLSPILFKRLPYDAQVGVIGHELSHVVDFKHKSFFGMMRVAVGNASSRYLDRFEYKTDGICIQHGLANNLLAWSIAVRQQLHVDYWRGADNVNKKPVLKERYMNPSTILNCQNSSRGIEELE